MDLLCPSWDMPTSLLHSAKKNRWIVLLFGSVVFFSLAIPDDRMPLMIVLKRCGIIILPSEREIKISLFCISILLTYVGGLVLQRSGSRILFFIFLILSVLPLIIVKIDAFSKGLILDDMASVIVPIGLSFYSLQEYAYLYDVYVLKQRQLRLLHYLRYDGHARFFAHFGEYFKPVFAKSLK